MTENVSGCAAYLKQTIQPKMRKKHATIAVKQLRELIKAGKLDCNAIAVRGVSGLLVGVTISDRLGLPLLVVRKGEQRHSYRTCEGVEHECDIKYIIVDDIVDSGATIKKIVETLDKTYKKPKCQGIYVYAHDFRYQSDRATKIFTKHGCLNKK